MSIIKKSSADWIKIPVHAIPRFRYDDQNKKISCSARLEVRAKVPKTKGIWPALVAWQDKWGWPVSREIDMLENISQQPDVVYSHHLVRTACPQGTLPAEGL